MCKTLMRPGKHSYSDLTTTVTTTVSDIALSYPLLSYSVLSYPLSFYSDLSCPILSQPLLTYSALSYLILSCPVLPYSSLPRLVVLYCVLTCLVLSYPILNCPVPPRPVVFFIFRFQKERCERLETSLSELKLEVRQDSKYGQYVRLDDIRIEP